jgi:cation:H+ antiporter
MQGLGFFGACAAVIVVAGIFLTRFADAIADLTGLGRLLVGSVLLAGATSLPELAVDINVVRLVQPNLAVGDLLGSCLCNLLILAILDLSRYSRGRMFSRISAAHALSAVMTILLAAIAVMAITTRPGGQTPGLGLGVGTLAIGLVYLGGCRLIYLDQKLAGTRCHSADNPAVPLPAHPAMGLRLAIVGFGLAACVILAVSPFLARAADELAEISGLGRTFVGTALLPLSTSLPELVASIASLRMGDHDLAIGNVFGSNAFNIAMLVVLDTVQPGPLLSVASTTHGVTDLSVIVVTAVGVAGLLDQVESRRRLLDPDAWLIFGLVLGAMGPVYVLG